MCWGTATFSMASGGNLTAAHGCGQLGRTSDSRRGPPACGLREPGSPQGPRGSAWEAGLPDAARGPPRPRRQGVCSSWGALGPAAGRSEPRTGAAAARSWSRAGCEESPEASTDFGDFQVHSPEESVFVLRAQFSNLRLPDLLGLLISTHGLSDEKRGRVEILPLGPKGSQEGTPLGILYSKHKLT